MIIYKPVKYTTREYTTGGWVNIEWEMWSPFVVSEDWDGTDRSGGNHNMYIETHGPELKCSKCNSADVARTLRKHATGSTWLVCLNCGHRGGEEKSPFAMDTKTHTFKYEPPEERVF